MAILSFKSSFTEKRIIEKDKVTISQPLSLLSKNKTTLFPSILKVGGNIVVLFFGLDTQGLRYGHYVFF